MTGKHPSSVLAINRLPHQNGTDIAHKVGLAQQLRRYLRDPLTKALLASRGLSAVVTSYEASNEQAFRRIYDAYKRHQAQEIGTYVLQSDAGTVVGMAEVTPVATVRHHRWPIPALGLKARTAPNIDLPGPLVRAWVMADGAGGNMKVLERSLWLLSDPEGPAAPFFRRHAELNPVAAKTTPMLACTLEPMADNTRHETAIRHAGFQEIARGYFSDADS